MAKKMKIVVTGGAGFIGSHLVDRLVKDGHKVLVIDNLSVGKKKNINKKAKFVKADIRDFRKIKPHFKGADRVVHLAAVTRVPFSIKEPLYTSEVNIMGTLNVFWAGIEAKVGRIISISSSSAYGNQKTLPLKEHMPSTPLSPYGWQKKTGEHFGKLFTDTYKTPIVSIRFFNVYGPRADINSDYSLVLGKFIRFKKEGKPLTIYGDGKQERGFSYVDDVVEGLVKALMSKKLMGGEVINLGNPKSYTVNYLADLIGGEKKYLPPRQGDIKDSRADITKARQLLGWEPKVSFEEGIRKTQKWFENN